MQGADAHSPQVGWLLTALFDNALPLHGETGASSVHACKRMMILRHVIKEMGWRGAALQRQLAHDLMPFLTSSLAQTRSCVGSCCEWPARLLRCFVVSLAASSSAPTLCLLAPLLHRGGCLTQGRLLLTPLEGRLLLKPFPVFPTPAVTPFLRSGCCLSDELGSSRRD